MYYFTALFPPLIHLYDECIKLSLPSPSNPCTWFCIRNPVVFSELHPQSLKPYVHCVKRAPIVEIIVGTSASPLLPGSQLLCMWQHK